MHIEPPLWENIHNFMLKHFEDPFTYIKVQPFASQAG